MGGPDPPGKRKRVHFHGALNYPPSPNKNAVVSRSASPNDNTAHWLIVSRPASDHNTAFSPSKNALVNQSASPNDNTSIIRLVVRRSASDQNTASSPDNNAIVSRPASPNDNTASRLVVRRSASNHNTATRWRASLRQPLSTDEHSAIQAESDQQQPPVPPSPGITVEPWLREELDASA